MSQSQQSGRPGRYQRSSGGLLGAMIVTVLLVLAFVGIRSLTSDNESTPVQTVDYLTAAKAGRADGKLMTLAPARLPGGWKATSADYLTGMSPSWHLGLLTAGNKYVGVEEARTSTEKLAEEHVDLNADRGPDVTIAGAKWQTWTDSGGDYAVARSLEVGSRTVESWMVVGTATEKEIRDLAGSLVGGPVPTASPSASASPTS